MTTDPMAWNHRNSLLVTPQGKYRISQSEDGRFYCAPFDGRAPILIPTFSGDWRTPLFKQLGWDDATLVAFMVAARMLR